MPFAIICPCQIRFPILFLIHPVLFHAFQHPETVASTERTLTPEELNIGVSLSLWRALQEERLDECRRLLQDKASIDHF